MKILQINVVYRNGSTGKIVYDIHNDLIKEGIQSIVCYGRGREVKEPGVYKVGPEWLMKMQSLRSRITGYSYSGCMISTSNVMKIIQKEKPEVVHLHCLNGYFVNIYKLLYFLKSHNVKTILTLHAEFMYTAGCGYSLDCEKWKTGCGHCPALNQERPKTWFFDKSTEEWNMMANAFKNFDNIVIVPVSEWLFARARQSPFLMDKKIVVVTNGIDTVNIFKPTNYLELQKKHRIKNEKIILHVTPDFLSPIKGGQYVLEIANRLKKDHVKIIIVGFQGNTKNLPENIIPVRYTKDQIELAAYYSIADITLLTSKKETFSMVCAESLACGTPIVGFEAGAPETISIDKYSEFVKQGDVDTLEIVIRRWLNKKEQYGDAISIEASNRYSKEEMLRKYKTLYKG